MPCPANCYFCSLMAPHVPVADRCPFCLDDWICDGCALEYDLTDVEGIMDDVLPESPDSSEGASSEHDVRSASRTTVPPEHDHLSQDTFSDDFSD